MMDDVLSADVIKKGLKTRFIGQRVLYYPSVDSTMEVARQEARRGAAEGTVIATDEQTGGRGRLKRTWLTPVGNIALSVVLYPKLSYLPSLIMLASLAVVHSIESATGLRPQIKWPNDVLINGKKVCGILIENDVQGNNANLRLADFPEIQTTATSLSDELGREISRLNVILHLLGEIERYYLAISAGESIYEEWRDKLVTPGKKVRVTAGETTYEGIAESVTRDGSLLLRGTDGSLTRIVAGDVTLRE